VQTAIYIAHQVVDDFNSIRGVLRQGTAQPTTEFSGIKCCPHRAVRQAVKIADGVCLRTPQDIVFIHSWPSPSFFADASLHG
jgi:hypothetical protein